MNKTFAMTCAGLLAITGTAVAVAAPMQHRPDPQARLKAERAAMKPLADMAGIWRGKATMTLPSGKHSITQTERVGPFLGGSVMVMEGRGYAANGKVVFNALGVMSFDPASKTYSMRAYAQGNAGTFPMKRTADGFTWDIKAGPVTMHYTATVKDGTWHEVGDRVMPNGKPVRFFEMTLKRVGDTDWPEAGAVPFKKP